MRREPLKIGDVLSLESGGKIMSGGEVVASHLTADRQIISVRTDAGDKAMVLDLTGDVGKPPIIIPPVDVADARAIALAVLIGVGNRMPVTARVNMLAAAVIDLTGGVA